MTIWTETTASHRGKQELVRKGRHLNYVAQGLVVDLQSLGARGKTLLQSLTGIDLIPRLGTRRAPMWGSFGT